MAGGVVSAAYIGTVADLGPERLQCQQNYDQESGDSHETVVSSITGSERASLLRKLKEYLTHQSQNRERI